MKFPIKQTYLRLLNKKRLITPTLDDLIETSLSSMFIQRSMQQTYFIDDGYSDFSRNTAREMYGMEKQLMEMIVRYKTKWNPK